VNGDCHGKARHLIARDRVEGIPRDDREWLDGHLAQCPECAGVADDTERALRWLRAVAVPLPPALASRAQLRVYLRAQERRPVRWVPWAACAVSWAAGIASSPYVWRGFEWLGRETGLPPLLWKTGFALWWAVPALLAAGAVWLEKSQGEGFRTR